MEIQKKLLKRSSKILRRQILLSNPFLCVISTLAVRDYIHVVDLADAHIKALDRLLSKEMVKNFEFFNLGTGTGYSVLDVIHSFEKTSGRKLPYVFAERRDGDVPQLFANATRANSQLNWKATLDLDSMTGSSWAWEKKLREAEIK